jgi:hypothetical protein
MGATERPRWKRLWKRLGSTGARLLEVGAFFVEAVVPTREAFAVEQLALATGI